MELIYLAARYSRAEEMQGVRDVLTGLGYPVTSRWIDHHGGTLPGSFTPEHLNTDPSSCRQIAQADYDDLAAADTLVSFTSAEGGGNGRRHVEHGIAHGLRQRVILIGPRENVFHTLPAVEHYPDWPHLVMALTPARPDRSHG
jgi:hypothetical protein